MKLSMLKPSVLIDAAKFDEELQGWWPRPLLWLFLLYLLPSTWTVLCSTFMYLATESAYGAVAVGCALACVERIGMRLEYSLGELAERRESSDECGRKEESGEGSRRRH